MQKLKVTMLGVAAVATIAVTMGILWEIHRERRLTTRYEPPGEMINVGSQSLHLFCVGAGSPPVLLEAGSGLAYTNWSLLQSGISQVTRTCSYDRSGLGWSESGSARPSANQAVSELARLPDSSGMAGPWIIVGHSLGGLYAQQFLNRYPDRVAALVLLDSSHEDMYEWFPPLKDMVNPGLAEQLSPLLTLIGLHRRSLPKVPEEDPSWVARELHATSKHLRRAAAEWWAMPNSARQVAEARTGWNDTPIVVVQAGRVAWPEAWPDSIRSNANLEWTEMQKDLARRSGRGRYFLLVESGHGIPWEHPETVIGAVDSLVREFRREPE